MLQHDICTSLMGSLPYLRGCCKGRLLRLDRMAIQVSCKEAMFAVTAVCSFKVASQKPNNKPKQNQTEHWAVARGKDKCCSSLLLQLRVKQKWVGVPWPGLGCCCVIWSRWWFFLESAGCSSFAHFSYIKKGSLQRGWHFFLFSWSATFFKVSLISGITTFVLNSPDEGGKLVFVGPTNTWFWNDLIPSFQGSCTAQAFPVMKQ